MNNMIIDISVIKENAVRISNAVRQGIIGSEQGLRMLDIFDNYMQEMERRIREIYPKEEKDDRKF